MKQLKYVPTEIRARLSDLNLYILVAHVKLTFWLLCYVERNMWNQSEIFCNLQK